MSGGDWSSGGTAYPQARDGSPEERNSCLFSKARESHDEMPRDSRPAASWQHSGAVLQGLSSDSDRRDDGRGGRGTGGKARKPVVRPTMQTQLRRISKPSREADSVSVVDSNLEGVSPK